jgi:DNA (cytosine-5)-methyltransferase 1
VGLSAISLFSGAGGLDLAAKRCGIRTVCYVEYDPYAQGVLMSRIRDGGLDDAPIWDDVRTFDGNPWRGKVDIVFGGFPCQPHSVAGPRRGGNDERNMWPDFMRVVREVEPGYVLGENVTGIVDNGFALQVLADLESAGYCATPYTINACAVGAPHPRQRVFFVAHAAGIRWEPRRAESNREGRAFADEYSFYGWLNQIPDTAFLRKNDGMAFPVDRIRLAGNGVHPLQAIPAFEKIKMMAQED